MLIASNPRLKRTKAGRYLKRNIKEPLAFLVRLERRIKLLFDSCLKISTIRDSIFYGVIPFFILSGIQKLYIEIQLSPANIELQLAMHIGMISSPLWAKKIIL